MTDIGSYKERGNMAEAIACAWLRKRGYDVFPNMSERGPVDIIAMKDGRVRKIDVKLVKPTYCPSRSGAAFVGAYGRALRKNQKQLGVEILYVSHDGFCAFSRRVMVDHFQKQLGVPVKDSKRGRPPKLSI